MTLDTRQLATKEDLLRVRENLLQVKEGLQQVQENLLHLREDLLRVVKEDIQQAKEDLRAELRHYATKADLWRAIAFQTIALAGIVAAFTKL